LRLRSGTIYETALHALTVRVRLCEAMQESRRRAWRPPRFARVTIFPAKGRTALALAKSRLDAPNERGEKEKKGKKGWQEESLDERLVGGS